MKSALAIRVNGVVIRRVKIREYISDGVPTGEQELVIFDPVLGSFTVDDRFVFEVNDLNVPAEARNTLPNEGWLPIRLPALIEMLAAAEVERQKNSGEGRDKNPSGSSETTDSD